MVNKIFGRKERGEPIEKRLFFISLILTAGLMGLYMVYGLILGYKWPVQLTYTAGFVAYTVLLILFKKGFSFRILSLIYYYLATFLLIVAWMPSGGLQGAIVRFAVLIYISGLMVLELKDFLAFSLLILVAVGVFSFLEVFGIVVPPSYSDVDVLRLDLAITNINMLAVTGLALYYFKREYVLDRNRLRRTNGELEEEKVKAQSADKAKTEFLATISHEMRTPLNGIVGISDLLRETDLDSNQKDYVDKLSYSSELLNNLISDVLDLTLIESGKIAFKEEPFQLEPELKEILNLVRPRLEAKTGQVELRLQLNADIKSKLVADIKRIRQILINFLVNAIKYTDIGFITLQVDVESTDFKTVEVKFTVSDTGLGIPKSRQDLLFRKFYKAHDQLKIEGTGLGLSIAKSLAECMGGRVGFTSEPGEGSEFYLNIPLKLDISHEEKIQSETTTPTFDFTKLKVLIAEDQDINMLVTKKMLEALGILDIGYAKDGEEVVLRAREKDYDVILMDIQMPKKDGIQAAREITESLADRSPVIIALTANVMKGDVEACLNAGMRDFIGKPFRKDQLIAVFDKHLRHVVNNIESL